MKTSELVSKLEAFAKALPEAAPLMESATLEIIRLYQENRELKESQVDQ